MAIFNSYVKLPEGSRGLFEIRWPRWKFGYFRDTQPELSIHVTEHDGSRSWRLGPLMVVPHNYLAKLVQITPVSLWFMVYIHIHI